MEAEGISGEAPGVPFPSFEKLLDISFCFLLYEGKVMAVLPMAALEGIK